MLFLALYGIAVVASFLVLATLITVPTVLVWKWLRERRRQARRAAWRGGR